MQIREKDNVVGLICCPSSVDLSRTEDPFYEFIVVLALVCMMGRQC